MQLNEILSILNNLKVEYSLFMNDRDSTKINYAPASVKNIVPNGIYFFQDDSIELHPDIEDSILISHKPLLSKNIEIIVQNPQLVHYKLTHFFVEEKIIEIHPTAIISPQAIIGENVSIGPYSVIGKCILEAGVCIKNHVVIEDHVTIKKNSFIDSHSVIGAAGLAWIWDESGNRIMQPQIGGVIIDEHCILATDVTVVKGSLSENTTIGAFTVIAHGTKIGHGSHIGKHVHMANNVSLAGNSFIGDSCFLGSACVISSNVILPNHTIVGAAGLVNKNFNEEFLTLAGVPAQIIKRNNFESKPKGAPKPFKK